MTKKLFLFSYRNVLNNFYSCTEVSMITLKEQRRPETKKF